ncbi:MAG TPA: Calx-beta domain-containing protein [Kofleriaceae bacterium]|nr:Calx-beta domain-containing protein [Kofleriaceae bacterium]
MAWLRLVLVVCALSACKFNPAANDDTGDATDSVTVEFTTSSSSADESGDVMVEVALSGQAGSTVTVSYGANDGSALLDSDYSLAGSTLTFAPGETTQRIPVHIIPDGMMEMDETFELRLLSASGATVGSNNAHTITISNDILPRVSFSADTSNSVEDQQTTITVQLDKAAPTQTTVEIGILGTSTASGADFTLAADTVVTFPAGSMTQTVQLGEIDDNLDEDPETVQLELKNASTGIIIGTVGTRTHTIDDNDDPPVLQFQASTSTAAENGGNKAIVVTLDNPSGKTVSASYSASGALGDATVVGAPGTVTFAPGETQQTITVTPIDDTIDEDNQSVTITLGNLSNATLGGRDTHTLTILDDDNPPSVQFTTAAQSVAEANTSVVVVATLSSASEKTVTMPFTTNGSTAQTPQDFSISTSPLTFAPGTTSRSLTIDVQDDNSDEADETVAVSITNPTNATIGGTATHSVTITDNDNAPQVSWDPTQSDAIVNEGDPPPNSRSFSYDVVLSAASGKQVTVPISFSGDADLLADYTVGTAMPLVFAPGETRKSVTIRVVADTTKETGADQDEDVIMTIDTVGLLNATRTNPFTRTHTIHDDD